MHYSAIERVVCSYSPTVKALLYACRRTEKLPSLNQAERQARIDIIGNPIVLRELTLTALAEEIERIRQAVGAHVQIMELRGKDVQLVKEALSESPITHFICHRNVIYADPTQSYLILQDVPLTVEDISTLQLRKAKLMYLSACHTGIWG